MVTNPGTPTVNKSQREAVAVGLERICDWAVKARSAPLPDPVRRRAALVVSDDIAAMVVAASEQQNQMLTGRLAAQRAAGQRGAGPYP